jgi:peptidoglycan/xylan/chitin deacetylase (PgdA/CDA1 family)
MNEPRFLMGKKDLLAKVLGRTVFRIGWKCPPGGRLFAVNYHRIRPETPGWTAPFDDGVYDVSVTELARHVRWLRKHTRVLRESELLEILETRRYPKEPCSIITFDDGYADNYYTALPILEREGVTAIFFIATGLTAGRRLGWWDLIAFIVKNTPRDSVEWRGQTIPLRPRRGSIRAIQRIMKQRPNEETEGLVQELAGSCEVNLPGLALQSAELMTWDQIRDLKTRGMDIGAHTHSHWVLATLPPGRQEQEIVECRSLLESETGAPVSSLAYPVGGPDSFTAETVAAAKSAGIRLAFSYSAATNPWPALDRYNIHRLLTPPDLSRLAAATVWPSVFAG